MTVYSLHKLTKVYGKRTVLDIDQLQLTAGRIYGLLGPNGAGKTTLLNILGFLEKPDSGSMDFFAKNVRFHESHLHLLRQDVTVLDQYPVLFTSSVYKNLEFGLKIRKMERAERERVIDEVLDLVDMGAFKHAPAYNLSGGETQRIALARALSLSPKVFLCDEPTASVDVENQLAIIDILKRINKSRNITIVFTTHDRLLASELAHQTLVLNNGQLVATSYENTFPCRVGTPQEHQIRCCIAESVSIYLNMGPLGSQVDKCRVFIDPEKLELYSPLKAPAASQYIQGNIVQLMEESHRIRAVVGVGFPLTVLMSRPQYDALRPGIGDTVAVVIPPDGATLLY